MSKVSMFIGRPTLDLQMEYQCLCLTFDILNDRVILKTRSWCYRYTHVVNLLPEVNLFM